jgi:hypothetical protein
MKPTFRVSFVFNSKLRLLKLESKGVNVYTPQVERGQNEVRTSEGE